MNLKPTTSYDFSKEDLAFVLELAKVGHVHLLSNQVLLIEVNEPSHHSSSSLTFKEYGGTDNKKCDGLVLPSNWVIEHISGIGHHQICGVQSIQITFGIKRIK